MFKCIAQSIISGSGTSSVTFSSIPQTYKSLIIYFSGGANVNVYNELLGMEVNGTNIGNYRLTYHYFETGVETATFGSGFKPPMQVIAGNNADNLQPGTGWIFLGNYTSSTLEKMGFNYGGLAGNSNQNGWVGATGYWANVSAAVETLTFTSNNNGTFKNGTAIYLYGIS